MTSNRATMLLQAKLVGVSNYTDAVSTLTAGDVVDITHEPTNEYDANAMVVSKNGQTVGYLARDVAQKVINKDTQRVFLGAVTYVTEHEGTTVGGYIQFSTLAGYLTPPLQPTTTKEEGTMSRFRIDDAVTSQGAEGWERGLNSVRQFRLPANSAVTIVPLTDYKTGEEDGGWLSFREVKAFGGVRIGNEVVNLPGRLLTFPAQDFIIVTGRDGGLKRQSITDPLMERIEPSKFESKRPRNAADDWHPPRHARPKDVTYLNCVFISGKLEEGERAKYNPKKGDHIILSMATTWYEDWKRVMERDRKKNADYSPAGRLWTLKIIGSFDSGNLALEADDELGEPIPLPDVINLDDLVEGMRRDVEAWVDALDGVATATFDASLPSTSASPKEVAADVNEAKADVDEYESLIADSPNDWSEEVPATLKKMLVAIGVQVKATAKPAELRELAAEHEPALLAWMAENRNPRAGAAA